MRPRRFGWNLDSGDDGERLRGVGSEAPLAWRRSVALYGVTRLWCLPLMWATLCIDAPMRISRDLAWCWGKGTTPPRSIDYMTKAEHVRGKSSED
jgi:hypothetical protein